MPVPRISVWVFSLINTHTHTNTYNMIEITYIVLYLYFQVFFKSIDHHGCYCIQWMLSCIFLKCCGLFSGRQTVQGQRMIPL